MINNNPKNNQEIGNGTVIDFVINAPNEFSMIRNTASITVETLSTILVKNRVIIVRKSRTTSTLAMIVYSMLDMFLMYKAIRYKD